MTPAGNCDRPMCHQNAIFTKKRHGVSCWEMAMTLVPKDNKIKKGIERVKEKKSI